MWYYLQKNRDAGVDDERRINYEWPYTDNIYNII